jgi:hydroxypyruvate reductase 1
VLTETTAELAAALTLAAARRVVEADAFMRGGHYEGWLPTLFIGSLLQNKTVRRRRCARGCVRAGCALCTNRLLLLLLLPAAHPPTHPHPHTALCQHHTGTHRAPQVGIIGAGRIGAAYARMMVEGHKMNLVYYDPYPNTRLEEYMRK